MDRTALRISFIPILFILAALIAPNKSFSQDMYAGIKRVIVIDFYDKTGKFNGSQVADLIRKEMSAQSKFMVLSKQGTAKKFQRLNITHSNMLNKNYRGRVGKHTGADAFIIGVIEQGKKSKYVLKLRMEKAASGQTVTAKSFPFNKFIGPNASKAATTKFLGKSGLRTETATAAAPPPAFIPPPEPMEDEPIVRRDIPEEEEEPSVEIAKRDREKKKKEKKEKKEKEYREPTDEPDWLTLKIAPAFFKNSYSVTNPAGSTVENLINVSTGLFPGFYFSGEWWFWKYLGIDFIYDMGFIKLEVQPPGRDAFDVNAKFWQLGGSLKGRYPFISHARSPYVFARFGYQIQKFSPTTPQPVSVLSSNKYSDIYIGIGTKFPFWFFEAADLGINFGFDYFMLSSLREHIVNNGTSNSSKGYQLSMGPYWKFYKWLFASFDFYYSHHSASYSNPDTARGSRQDAVDGAKSKDNVMGFMLGIGFNL